jgi:UDP-galactopyranose mutase
MRCTAPETWVPADVLIVGAGYAGSVCARILAEADIAVRLIDRRDHIAGNAYDERDSHGILVHRYGPHIFHTNSDQVFAWLSQFTTWRPYEHRVLADVDGRLVPFPINARTIEELYGLTLDPDGMRAFLDTVREPRELNRTSEDVVIGAVGRELCNTFYRGYTRKQWGVDLADLAPTVVSRIPVRLDRDDRYFSDAHQAMPTEGYAEMFKKMLDHPRIGISLQTSFASLRERSWRHVIYTGPVDEYFDHKLGHLPYRSLEFEHTHLANVEKYQPVGTVNYPNRFPFTRVTEFKHLTGQLDESTSIVKEYPTSEGDPYYPMPTPSSEALHQQYRELVQSVTDTTFVGRLAQYRYYNMDQVVAAALATSRRLVAELREPYAA